MTYKYIITLDCEPNGRLDQPPIKLDNVSLDRLMALLGYSRSISKDLSLLKTTNSKMTKTTDTGIIEEFAAERWIHGKTKKKA